MSRQQYGFRTNHSTELAITAIYDDMNCNKDTKLITCTLFLDLSKAFDCADHDIYDLYADDINLHISGKIHKIIEKKVNNELKKIEQWVRANKLCINYSKRNFMLMINHNNINFSVSPISKQSSLKYLGNILDDKPSWKPQVEKLVTQFSKSYEMLLKLKHYTNISMLKPVDFAPFHSYLTYSILNVGRANKTTSLTLIRLQNKAVRTLKNEKN